MFPSYNKLTDGEFVQNSRLLSEFGYKDPDAAAATLLRLRRAASDYESSRKSAHTVPPWYKTLKRILLEVPFPESVLDTVDKFARKSRSTASVFELFEQTPRSLEILARLSCASRFLTECVLNQPDALWQLATERRTAEVKSRNEFRSEASAAVEQFQATDEKLGALRRYQHREILRIGMCDAFGLLDLKYVTLQISLLADAMVQVCLEIVCDESAVDQAPFCVLALGKHGGEELNYSSDIDLILIAQKTDGKTQRIARKLIDALSCKLPTGFLYRVDMRLRPWGDAGPLVITPGGYEAYLQSDAALWEKQSLLKARVIAGDKSTGEEFLKRVPCFLFTDSPEEILRNVRGMKGNIEQRLQRTGRLESEVKLGSGSIRDIEFLTQALQLIHGRRESRLLSANTLDALIRLAEFSIIGVMEYRQLREGYIFFRTIEHALQLLHNQQTHELPSDAQQCEWLARRLDFHATDELLKRFNEHRRAVRRIFDDYFPAPQKAKQRSKQPKESVPPEAAARPSTVLEQWLREDGGRRADYFQHQLSESVTPSTCRVTCERSSVPGDHYLVAVVAPDVTGVLSAMCGVLFAGQFDIREGFSVAGDSPVDIGVTVPEDRFFAVMLVRMSTESVMDRPVSATTIGRQIQENICELLSLRQQEGSSAIRERLLELFCRRLQTVPESEPASLADISVQVTNDEGTRFTQLNIAGDDSVGFFFEVSNALAICGFRIRHARLGEQNGRISDVLHVTEDAGGPVTLPDRIEELQTAVTLIKQFTTWLPSNSDPHRALLRFRDLLHQLLRGAHWETSAAALRQPEVLRTIGQVLGLSRYLWEDFLQVQTDQLLPLLSQKERLAEPVSRAELKRECNQRMRDIQDSVAARQALNAFKDYHLFRIDLRHVLGHCGPFGSFSDEVTGLADVVVTAACERAYQELSTVHGVPRLNSGNACAFTLAALGKFGGAEMGFASDLEIILVFQEECRTDRSGKMSAGSFFERLVARIQDLIESRRKGIFEIDLRMRPYGQAGSAAISRATFEQYFSPDGDAWPYERQSLVKLRCVGGMPEFGEEINASARNVAYAAGRFDFDAMRALREKQVRQLVRGGMVNAKLSSGGLVDCEYAVQALQMSFGRDSPALQTTNTMHALAQAHSYGYIETGEFEAVRAAYQFLRELIDCLRMVRGNAEDLTVPPHGSADYAHLVKRMQSVHDSPILPDDLESQMAVVSAFSRRVEQICSRSE